METYISQYTGSQIDNAIGIANELSKSSDLIESERLKNKNLFNIYGNFIHGGIEVPTVLPNGNFETVSNLYYHRAKGIQIYNLKSNTNYTFSGNAISTESSRLGSGAFVAIEILDTQGTQIIHTKYLYSLGNFNFTFNTGSNTEIRVVLTTFGASGEANKSTVFSNLQLEEGTIVTTYEAYYGKITHDGGSIKKPNLSSGVAYQSGGVAHIVENYLSSDGLTWYRLWSDGWKECGGEVTTSSSDRVNLNLPLSFSNTNYCAYGSFADNTGGSIQWTRKNSVSQIQLVCSLSGNKVMTYYCCGY